MIADQASTLSDRIAALSPAQREALGAKLRQSKEPGRPSAMIPRRPAGQSCPLSYAQQRLWFLQQMDPLSAAYNWPLVLRLSGDLNTDAFERTLQEVVQRHETLRTHFPAIDGMPTQVVSPAGALRLTVHDVTGRLAGERNAVARQLVAEEVSRPFDLARGPLIRASLIRIEPADHVLVLTMHHIVSDGWSVGVLFNEMAQIYRALLSGAPSPLPPLPIQYGDFATWQREWLSGSELERQLAYWRGQLADAPTLDLPTDRPRPLRQTHVGAVETLVVSPETSAQLKLLCQREGVTPAIALQALFKALLHRYTGQDDIVIGSPIANRTRREIEGLIGFFVNTLVMRTSLAGDPTVRELLSREREIALAAYEHQDLPFERLVQEVRPERDLGRHPLFQVMFSVQNTATGDLDLPGLTVSSFPLAAIMTRFDLECHVFDGDAGLRIVFAYNIDLFDEASVRRLARHYAILLGGAVAGAERRISELPLMADDELTLMAQWRGDRAPYPRDSGLAELFERQVEQTPDAVAVAYEDESLTYGELNRRANQLARYLRGLGVGSEVRVGLCVERSLDMVLGVLGIVKAGGAYVPLDPEYPAARIAFMAKDAEVALVLTQRRWAETVLQGGAGGRVAVLEDVKDEIARQSAENPPERARADQLAYMIYTSGSTGQPKGVCIEHRSVVRLVMNPSYVDFGPGEVFLQYAPLAFDASTFELWGSLLHGAKLVVAPAGKLSLEELTTVIQRRGITTLWLTAAVFHQVVERHWDRLAGVRQLLAGGEALSVSHVQRVLDVIGVDQRLVNGYGPTENTTFTCCHVMTRGSHVGATVPIGRPIANTQVYVLDGRGRAVPIGVPGELCIGGDGLAREYWRRPELTAERFVANPVWGRLYRTGDLARYLPDGTLEFLGRRDHQVKVRGYRIELGEIEAVALDHPSVEAAVVVVREDEPGNKRLVAYLVPRAGAETDLVRELRGVMRSTLPAYMVPSHFVILDRLPLTPIGKVDRRALPIPEGRHAEAAYVAPRTDVERQLADIWCQVFHLERVGIHDNFFELGGHSLLATQVISRIRDTLNVDLPLRALFETPTVAGLADAYAKVTKQTSQPSPITRVARENRRVKRSSAD